jgi:hypothetical protein
MHLANERQPVAADIRALDARSGEFIERDPARIAPDQLAAINAVRRFFEQKLARLDALSIGPAIGWSRHISCPKKIS